MLASCSELAAMLVLLSCNARLLIGTSRKGQSLPSFCTAPPAGLWCVGRFHRTTSLSDFMTRLFSSAILMHTCNLSRCAINECDSPSFEVVRVYFANCLEPRLELNVTAIGSASRNIITVLCPCNREGFRLALLVPLVAWYDDTLPVSGITCTFTATIDREKSQHLHQFHAHSCEVYLPASRTIVEAFPHVDLQFYSWEI